MTQMNRLAVIVVTLAVVALFAQGCGGAPIRNAPAPVELDISKLRFDMIQNVTQPDGNIPYGDAYWKDQGFFIKKGLQFKLQPRWYTEDELFGDSVPGATTTLMGTRSTPAIDGVLENLPEPYSYMTVGAGTVEITGSITVYYDGNEHYFEDTDTIIVFE